MTQQIAIRIPDDIAAGLDALIEAGRFPTRTAAIRAGIADLVARERRRRIDQAIVDGYRRVPPTADETRAATTSSRETIADEPW